MAVKSIRDLDINGKRVFFRFDFNVPLDGGCGIRDDTRIRRAVPTLKLAVDRGARCILSSHLGRPKGKRNPELSLKPVADRLSELLASEVRFAQDCIGPEVKTQVDSLNPGELLLLENLRFHAGETKNDPEFAKELGSLADVFVNDAFGTAHRAHASTVGIARFVDEKAAGLLLTEELDSLHKAFADPERPLVALFGGAKVSDKLGVLENLAGRFDTILIGGGMANTFLKAQGVDPGKSATEDDLLETAGKILDQAEKSGRRIILPVDVVTAEIIEPRVRITMCEVGSIPSSEMALDIGPRTSDMFSKEISTAGTVVWNGPMGVFETEPFKNGTLNIARAVGGAKAFSVVGGGDTVRALKQFGIEDRISYISTGGGAFMEYMEGKTLPGVAALEY